jgi:hypothetical protein
VGEVLRRMRRPGDCGFRAGAAWLMRQTSTGGAAGGSAGVAVGTYRGVAPFKTPVKPSTSRSPNPGPCPRTQAKHLLPILTPDGS